MTRSDNDLAEIAKRASEHAHAVLVGIVAAECDGDAVEDVCDRMAVVTTVLASLVGHFLAATRDTPVARRDLVAHITRDAMAFAAFSDQHEAMVPDSRMAAVITGKRAN
jgi:hypothetical protein